MLTQETLSGELPAPVSNAVYNEFSPGLELLGDV